MYCMYVVACKEHVLSIMLLVAVSRVTMEMKIFIKMKVIVH